MMDAELANEMEGVKNERKTQIRQIIKKLGPLIGLFALSLALTFASPYFLTMDNIMNVARQFLFN